ncbi:hypothetical protein GWI33_019485 [Rhynchophorus ferrugineus]|uniref:Uncharacterized protein n=1 Tax=Rhynchophorus ferrugineus TaxID=354439 RepID=A0A834M0G6_RHYFE|nr:hypothetical protein GWI33_019485 [Rhynchophorus ferrugineus]
MLVKDRFPYSKSFRKIRREAGDNRRDFLIVSPSHSFDGLIRWASGSDDGRVKFGVDEINDQARVIGFSITNRSRDTFLIDRAILSLMIFLIRHTQQSKSIVRYALCRGRAVMSDHLTKTVLQI